jgi:hypothetical protein
MVEEERAMSPTKALSFLLFCATTYATSAHATTHTWISFDGDFSASTSWNTGKAPSQWLPSDTVLFNGNVQTSVTTGLDQSSVRIAAMYFDPNYYGNVGSSGLPLIISVDTFNFRSEFGVLSYKAVRSTDKMQVTIIDGNAVGHLLWGDHDMLILKDGYTRIQQSATIQTLILDRNSSNYPPSALIERGAPISQIVSAGAQVENRRNVAPGCSVHVESGEFLQTGVLENDSRLEVRGGRFEYEAIDELPSPGPIAEFRRGISYFTAPYYPVRFRYGFKSFLADVYTNEPLQLMGIVDLSVGQPPFQILQRGDSDGDGVFDMFDVCNDTPPDVPVGPNGRPLADLNNDCKVDLRDFAEFQKSMY